MGLGKKQGQLKITMAFVIVSKGRRDYQMPSKWPYLRSRDRRFNVTNGR